MYVFWGCVVFISIITKLLAYFTRGSSSSVSGDLEHMSNATPPRSLFSKLKLKLNYLFITPATIGKRSVEPHWYFCTVPPLVESAAIFIFIALNIILNAVNFEAFAGNTYYATNALQIWRYIGDRSGIIAFANLPILWLFGMRNNVLQWLVGWTPATFNNFHRWVARVATVEAIWHSIAWTREEFYYGRDEFYSDWTQQYWYMGGMATVHNVIDAWPFSILAKGKGV